MARRFGATRWGMIGTFVGGLVGAALGTARAGTGALVGRVAATTFKLVIGLAIAFFTLEAAYAAL